MILLVHTQLSNESAMIHGDAVRLQQIVWNLLTNAIKFSPKQSVINVELKYIEEQNKRLAQIKVSDHGKGIPPEFLPHIFKQFSQADSTSTRTHGGLGLGLSIVSSLVEMQNGAISAENAIDGKGAVFTVTFPLVSHQSAITQTEIEDGIESLSNANGETKDHAPRLDGLRILLVDDDDGTLESISIYLKSFGAKVMAVGSVSEALKSFHSFKPTILVSDISMPGEDGYSLIRQIRGLRRNQGGCIPALALSACATEDDVKQAVAAGFQAHLAKPVEANNLGREILKFAGQKNT